MPKGKWISKRKPVRSNGRKRNHRVRPTKGQNTTRVPVHRRLVLYPNVKDAGWLQKLAWYASIALKLIKLVVGVADDLRADSVITGSGTSMILGPGDFASVAPFSVSQGNANADHLEIRHFPFERASLRSVTAKIVPSVDLGTRGGMYAACLMPIDGVDDTLGLTRHELIRRYPNSYDDIIKNPRAKLVQVTKPIQLSLTLPGRPSNIRYVSDTEASKTTFRNAFPTCVLCVAFSDLAEKQTSVASNYAPNKALFEVHLKGDLAFHEPGDLNIGQNDAVSDQYSAYTTKVMFTESTADSVQWFSHTFDVPSGERLDLRKIPRPIAHQMLSHFGRRDLIQKLESEAPQVEEAFEMLSC